MTEDKYRMTISRLTIDKLGVKLYDRASAVIAELVANAYDADAEVVSIEAPMGAYLATVSQGRLNDAGYSIVVRDNGCGMSPDVINPFYLKVGGERRADPQRGNRSDKYGRLVMGRKGVGKLAPFGICYRIEVISSGGDLVEGEDENGNSAKGYRTAHFIMERDAILSDVDEEYSPATGPLDETVQPSRGTRIVMSDFINRKVPEMETFNRQLAQRFGVKSHNWQIRLVDTNLVPGTEGREAVVGDFTIETMPSTRISLEGPTSEAVDHSRKGEFRAVDEHGRDAPGAEAGFTFSDGRFYPVLGWIAYAKESYRDELMAGVRIYCRGKIAAQTSIFNRKSGFTGEFNIRSYLVGELHADWLDQDEDLIQTDRRDILWSDGLGQAFEEWGQRIVTLIGTKSREPMKKKIWEQFLDAGDVTSRIERAYPGDRWKPVRDTTFRLAKLMGERLRQDEVQDTEHVGSLVQLSLMLGPHVQLDESLRDAASEEKAPIGVMATILKTARVAELSSYGMIAEKRVRVIERILGLTDGADTDEQQLQDSLFEAPWLINPLWSPITANQSLATLRDKFEQFFKKRTGNEISLSRFSESKKRPDFVLSSDDFGLQIIEIKKPNHKIKNDEWDRIQVYIDQMEAFLNMSGNEEFKTIFKRFTVTIVCDEVGLTGAQHKAFVSFRRENVVEQITWTNFLRRTRTMHEEFLAEAERQRELAVE